jgi:hypothetical protein
MIITTYVVSLIPDRDEMFSEQPYVVMFVRDIREVWSLSFSAGTPLKQVRWLTFVGLYIYKKKHVYYSYLFDYYIFE